MVDVERPPLTSLAPFVRACGVARARARVRAGGGRRLDRTPATGSEWRGFATVKALLKLRAYGRL
jgi:hypothetical protein